MDIDRINKKHFKLRKHYVLVATYIIVASIFFVALAREDIYNATENSGNQNTLRLYADHPTYVNYFRELKENPFLFLAFKPNFIGPFVVLYIVGDNLNNIFFFNIFCLIISLILLYKYISIEKLKYTLLVLINPITFISLFSLNKEIVTLLAVNIFITYIVNRNILMLILSVIIGILARKELSLLFLAFHFMTLFYRNWDKKIIINSVATLIIVTLFGFIIDQTFSSISDYSTEIENTVSNTGSGGTILLLNKIQNSYGYIWVFLPKTIMNLVGSVLSRTYNLFFFEDVYNDVVVWGQSLLFIYIVPNSYLSYKKEPTFSRKKLLFVFIILCILFSYIPVIQNRYFYPGYLLLATLITLKDKAN